MRLAAPPHDLGIVDREASEAEARERVRRPDQLPPDLLALHVGALQAAIGEQRFVRRDHRSKPPAPPAAHSPASPAALPRPTATAARPGHIWRPVRPPRIGTRLPRHMPARRPWSRSTGPVW